MRARALSARRHFRRLMRVTLVAALTINYLNLNQKLLARRRRSR